MVYKYLEIYLGAKGEYNNSSKTIFSLKISRNVRRLWYA
jgi:hypothetical protein